MSTCNHQAGAAPRFATHPKRLQSLLKRRQQQAKAKLSYRERRQRAAQHAYDARQRKRARRHELPDELRHLQGTPRPPAATYLARLAAAEAAAAAADAGAAPARAVGGAAGGAGGGA